MNEKGFNAEREKLKQIPSLPEKQEKGLVGLFKKGDKIEVIGSNDGKSYGELTLTNEVLGIGRVVYFDEDKELGKIKDYSIEGDTVIVQTEQGEFRLASKEIKSYKDVDFIETAQGSVYTYLPNGKTQRLKKAERKEYEPQDALVFVPDYQWVNKHVPSQFRSLIGENEVQFEQNLLSYVQEKGKRVFIVDEKGNRLETNQDIENVKGQVLLALGDKEKIELTIPVSKVPRLGYLTFDTRKFKSGEEYVREKHFGNKVVKIVKRG
jgi:hypothetical protein